jgi:hypothetical protein
MSSHTFPLLLPIIQPPSLFFDFLEYYTYDEEGLAYDYPSKTLKYASGRELDLVYTCKMVANEMKSVHHCTNSITFIPSRGETDECGFRGLQSRSARFEHLLISAWWSKLLMLHHAAECVTDDIIAKVIQKYPSIASNFGFCFRAIRHGTYLTTVLRHLVYPRDIFMASFCDAVQFTLDLIATHPKFEDLVSRVWSIPDNYRHAPSPFPPGSHQRVLAWRPEPWAIPSIEELISMEQLLGAEDPDEWDWARKRQDIEFYFSATAICVTTLARLESNTPKKYGLSSFKKTVEASVILNVTLKDKSSSVLRIQSCVSTCSRDPLSTLLLPSGKVCMQ